MKLLLRILLLFLLLGAGRGVAVGGVSGSMIKEGRHLIKQLITGEAELVKSADGYLIRMIAKNGDDFITFKQGEALSVFIDASGVSHPCSVVNVRPGTNGKYVIIGRSMGPVTKVAQDLENLVGKGKVSILDDAFLNGKTFDLGEYDFVLSDGTRMHIGEGTPIYDKYGNEIRTLGTNEKWTVEMAVNDMMWNPSYKNVKTGGKILNPNDLKKIPMYKIDQQWMEFEKINGSEIINIGNPLGITDGSEFYDMEMLMMNFN